MNTQDAAARPREIALLSDYLNLKLSPEALREIDRRISGCARCAEFAASLEETVALCRQYKPGESPRPLAQEVRVRLFAAWQKIVAETVTPVSTKP